MPDNTADRFVWGPVEVEAVELRPEELGGRRILILGGDPANRAALAEALRRHGADVEQTVEQTVEQAAAASAGPIDGIIDLNLCGHAFDANHFEIWEPAVRNTIAALQSCYEPWLAVTDARRIFYVAITQMGGRMGYDGSAIQQPLGGIWAGLAKTLPQELPNCNVRVIDVDDRDPEQLAATVLRELYNWGLFEIGWQGARRFTLSARKEQAEPDGREFKASDTVVLSGGGRGIGFELARHLAETRGCRVVITGRENHPDAGGLPISLGEEECRRSEQELLKEAARSGSLAAARNRIRRERRTRELARNLRMASERGLPIEYRQCDITDAAQVAALFEKLETALAAVIHNAGIDDPLRLAGKSADSFVRTLRTKIDGFFHLLSAARRKRVGIFCSVGSLTGRWGGMPGETDYAAANEGLARCGMWAAANSAMPVKTIAWPTWNRVGMIKNFEIAAAYMAPLDVQEGLSHWQRELNARGSSEVTFIGNVGPALTPAQLRGFPPSPDLPNLSALYTKSHFLGEVAMYAPFSKIVTRSVLRSADTPALEDFLVDGRASVPVGILLEHAASAGDWVQPGPHEHLDLREVRDVAVWLRRLHLDRGEFAFERRATGAWLANEWLVQVQICRAAESDPVLSATLHYSREAGPAGPTGPSGDESRTGGGNPVCLYSRPPLQWRGFVFRTGQWRWLPDSLLTAALDEVDDADIWVKTFTPRSRIPLGAFESVLRAAAITTGEMDCERLSIGSASIAPSGRPAALASDLSSGAWRVFDSAGNVCLQLRDVRFHSRTARNPAGIKEGAGREKTLAVVST